MDFGARYYSFYIACPPYLVMAWRDLRITNSSQPWGNQLISASEINDYSYCKADAPYEKPWLKKKKKLGTQ